MYTNEEKNEKKIYNTIKKLNLREKGNNIIS